LESKNDKNKTDLNNLISRDKLLVSSTEASVENRDPYFIFMNIYFLRGSLWDFAFRGIVKYVTYVL